MAADNEQDQTTATAVALLKQDFQHVSETIEDLKEGFNASVKELKGELKEYRDRYYTKEQAANLRSELITAHNNLADRVAKWETRWQKFWSGIAAGVIVIIIAAIVLTALKLNVSIP